MYAMDIIEPEKVNATKVQPGSHLALSRTAHTLASPAQLLDHRAIDFHHLLRARYWMEQTFEYTYPGPVYDLRQKLIVIPPDDFGDQHLCLHELHASSPLATAVTEFDDFGNRLIRITVPQVDERIVFTMKMVVERDFTADRAPRLNQEAALRFATPTHLTTPDGQIESLAQRFRTEYPEPERFGTALNTWIYETMSYGRGATTVHTTASEALQIGKGLCQDYAHIMLAIARAAGYCARYVSGHLLGEGRSHAWVELLIPETPPNEMAEGEPTYRAVALDPTNHRRTTPAYLTIAVGRDYSDVSPASGTFTAPYPGQLHTTKRAGITHIDIRHGA